MGTRIDRDGCNYLTFAGPPELAWITRVHPRRFVCFRHQGQNRTDRKSTIAIVYTHGTDG